MERRRCRWDVVETGFLGKFLCENLLWSFTIPIPGVFPLEDCVELQSAFKDQFLCLDSSVGENLDNLRNRRLVVIDWCCMCKKAGESINHLLLHCPIARELWNMVFTLFGLSWAMPNYVVELLASWTGKFSKNRNGAIWNMVPHCLMCGSWRERNALTFEGTERSIQDLKMSFFQTLFGWMNASGNFLFCSFSDLLDRCSLHISYFCFFFFFFFFFYLSTRPVCKCITYQK